MKGALAWLLLSVFGWTHGQAQEILVSMTTTEGNMIMRIQGDPDDYIPNLQSGISTGIVKHTISGNDGTLSFYALAANNRDKTIVWSNPDDGDIEAVLNFYTGGKSIDNIHTVASDKVHSIAVDWTTDNVYWTDAIFNRVSMANLRPTFMHENDAVRGERVVVRHDLKEPWGLAVHPAKSYLFWTDRQLGRVERSSMSGEQRTLLDNSPRPTSLTVDVRHDRVYWLDVLDSAIKTCTIYGTSCSTLVTLGQGAYYNGLAVYGGWIMTTDQDAKKLTIIKIDNHSDNVGIPFNGIKEIYDVAVYSAQEQPLLNSSCSSAGCEHICVGSNDNTDAQCLCSEGFHMLNGKCTFNNVLSAPRYLFVGSEKICHVPGNAPYIDTEILETQMLNCFANNFAAVSLANDIGRGYLYGLQRDTATIIRLTLTATKIEEVEILMKGVHDAKGLSVDWVTGNVYWSESKPDTSGRIGVVTLENRAFTVYSDISSPRDIAVDPAHSTLYWISLGDTVTIQSGSMAGRTPPQTLVTSDMMQPLQLTLDPVDRILYWTDADKHTVEAFNLVTKTRQTIYSNPTSSPYGLTVYQDHIAWTDRMNNIITWAHRSDGRIEKQGSSLLTLGAMLTWDIYGQPDVQTDVCPACDRICLLHSAATGVQEAVCACGVGYTIDGSTCVTAPVVDNFFLIADASLHAILQLDIGTSTFHAIDTRSIAIDNPVAVAYDALERKVYWSDVATKTINSVGLYGTDAKVVLHTGDDSVVDGIALDSTGRWLYYTDTHGENIRKVGMDGGGGASIEVLDLHLPSQDVNPRDVVLDLTSNLMYWTDWGDNPRIERADLNGNNRQLLISGSMTWPNGLAVDITELCWCDAGQHTVECAALDGSGRRTLHQGSTEHFYGIEMTPTHIYISAWTSMSLLQVDRATLHMQEFGDAVLERPMGIHHYSSTVTPAPPPSMSTSSSASGTTTASPTTTTTSPRTPTTTTSTRTPTTTSPRPSSPGTAPPRNSSPWPTISTAASAKIEGVSTLVIAASVAAVGVVLLAVIISIAICCCVKTCKTAPTENNILNPLYVGEYVDHMSVIPQDNAGAMAMADEPPAYTTTTKPVEEGHHGVLNPMQLDLQAYQGFDRTVYHQPALPLRKIDSTYETIP